MGQRRVQEFQERVWAFYREQGRDLPWRRQVTPYGVLVSEVMLQQTQVARVLERWPRWMERWPSVTALAAAERTAVLAEWQGLGYNRRVLWLHQAAQRVAAEGSGQLPRDPAVLVTLPGIGPNTAGSIAAFAYNVPVVFIETNIRRVFIYHYEELGGVAPARNSFSRRRTPSVSSREPISEPAPASSNELRSGANAQVAEVLAETLSDAQLRPLIEATLDRDRPREWYWALMDYGADLVKRVPNPNRRSRHYAMQSRFEGSLRQLRGEVLRRLLSGPQAATELGLHDTRLPQVLVALEREGFVERADGAWRVRPQ